MNRTRALLLACGVPLLIVLGLLVSAGLSSGDRGGRGEPAGGGRTPARTARFAPPGSVRTDVGHGARGAAIFRPREPGPPGGPVVVFLHGWLAVDPARYGPWIGHLVRRGATVIYPTYQQAPYLDTVTPLPSALVALRLAFEHVPVAPRRLVVVGHSAGGALAADYAASARSAGLPEPAAVFSVYPGRALRGISPPIPAVDAHAIASRTRVLVYAGAGDHVVGTRAARAIARAASRARTTLHVVRDHAVDDHNAPQRSLPASRRTFWEPLDRLIAATA